MSQCLYRGAGEKPEQCKHPDCDCIWPRDESEVEAATFLHATTADFRQRVAPATGSHVHGSEDGNATAAADAEAILRVTEIILEGKDRLIAAFREYAEMEARIDSGEASPELADRARRIRDGLLIGTHT